MNRQCKIRLLREKKREEEEEEEEEEEMEATFLSRCKGRVSLMERNAADLGDPPPTTSLSLRFKVLIFFSRSHRFCGESCAPLMLLPEAPPPPLP